MNAKNIIGTWRQTEWIGNDGKITTYEDKHNWIEFTFYDDFTLTSRHQYKGLISAPETQKWSIEDGTITVNAFGMPYYTVTVLNENELAIKNLKANVYLKFKRISRPQF